MSNFINDIEITNFKSIRHQEIEGCKKVNVFIGYPNVGKSNILEALSSAMFFRYIDARSNFSLKDSIRIESGNDLFFEGETSKNAQITIDGTFSYIYSYDDISSSITELLWILDRDGIKINGIKIKYKLLFNQDLQIDTEQLKAEAINFSKRKNKKSNKFSDNLTEEYLVPRVAKYEYNSERDGEDKTSGGRLLFPFGDNLYKVLSENIELRNEVSELFEQYNLRLVLDKQSNNIKILKENQDSTIYLLPYSLIADTLKRLIFYKAAIKTNQNSVLLFEEPEAHMFPPYIRKFTSDIIFDKTNQFFIATHSPYVLEEFLEEIPDDLAIYLVDYKNGETIIKALSNKDLEEVKKYGVDLFFNLESYLNNGEVNNA